MKKTYGFRNKKITIMGLGLHGGGVGSAQFFAEEGAKVIVTDIKSEENLLGSINILKKYKNIDFVIGQHRPEDFISADLIIKNPAISPKSKYLEIARTNKIPIKTDIDIFLEHCLCEVIGVTGTKGKSTTVYLIRNILREKFDNVIMAGNVRVSVLAKLKEVTKKSICILELSSAQLEDLSLSSNNIHIAVILNILPDHLNRHKNFQAYIDAKKKIFSYQEKDDFLILNQEDRIVQNFAKKAKSKILFFGKDNANGAYVDKKGAIYFATSQDLVLKRNDYFKILGNHNTYNLLASITVAKLYNIENNKIKNVVRHYKKPKGRLELIRTKKGISFYNDTTATMPDAAVAGINSFPSKNIILIAGGEDKGLDYTQLAEEIIKKVNKLILFKGTASEKILTELKSKLKTKNKELTSLLIEKSVSSMTCAVKLAFTSKGRGNNIVLLSPGAASFNMFENEFDRGDQFNKAVLEL